MNTRQNYFVRQIPVLLFLVLLVLPWSARADAPEQVSGKVYWEVATRTGVRLQEFSVIELRENDVFTEWARKQLYTVNYTATYLTTRTGTYHHEKSGPNEARLEFIPEAGTPEVRELVFEQPMRGTLNRPYDGMGGNFELREVRPREGLLNISTRLEVRRDAPAIIGFIVGGEQRRQVLVRAVGPSLATFDVAQPAIDPQFQFSNRPIYPGPTGEPWAATPEAKATNELAASLTGAFPLLQDSNDKSDVLTLTPGAYTITVSASTPEQEGAVLMEIYELP